MTDETPTTPEAPADGFDPGAAFTPDAAPAPEAPTEPIRFGVGAVKSALRKGTGALNDFAGETVHADLQMTEFEAGLIAPGVVKYLEARPQLAATVAAGGNEYLQAAVGMGVYGVRVTRERAKAIADAEPMPAEEPEGFDGGTVLAQAPIVQAG